MVVAAMQGADQNIRSNLGFRILPKDTLICIPGELNQQPSDHKMLALPAEPQLDAEISTAVTSATEALQTWVHREVEIQTDNLTSCFW